jgi:uroporphyrin-3 C-methyltransferase
MIPDMPAQMPSEPGAAAGVSGGIAPMNPPHVAAARPSAAVIVALVLALLSLVVTGMAWQRVSGMREQLARQSADSAVQAV